jgi:hypothetical protein
MKKRKFTQNKYDKRSYEEKRVEMVKHFKEKMTNYYKGRK